MYLSKLMLTNTSINDCVSIKKFSKILLKAGFELDIRCLTASPVALTAG